MNIKMPHTLVLLFSIMVLALVATYLLPQGNFKTTLHDGAEVVVPGTYRQIENPEKLSGFSLFTVLPKAFADSQAIIFFIFIIGGALAVVKSTGAIDAVLGKMLKTFGYKPQILIFISMFVFAAGSASFGHGRRVPAFRSAAYHTLSSSKA
ncbi:MAG: hypothetical protein ACFCUU_18180 [Cyclobacteriaceae bacterium]